MPFALAFLIHVGACLPGIHRRLGWIGLMILASVTACASVPPRELIERNDHAGLAAWYEQEAVRLRGKAEEMKHMVAEYAKPSYQPSPKTTKSELIRPLSFLHQVLHTGCGGGRDSGQAASPGGEGSSLNSFILAAEIRP
jgi:hypothetical protein